MVKELIQRFNVFRKLTFLPGHFYSPVLMPNELKGIEEIVFNSNNCPLPGVNLNVEKQFELLKKMGSFYKDIPFTHTPIPQFRYYFDNSFFSYNSGIELFCLIRNFLPKKIIEVGSGYSSALMLDVNELFFERKMQLTFIEPYPENRLNKLLRKDDLNSISVFKKRVQEIDLDIFLQLEENDILFIDSSHVSKPGSDVNTIIFRILPILKPGVIIHFHDIFYPFEYPKNWIMNEGGFGWNEGYLLHAFLMNNNEYKIIFFNSYMEEKYSEWFQVHMPLCLKKQGGSIYLQKQ